MVNIAAERRQMNVTLHREEGNEAKDDHENIESNVLGPLLVVDENFDAVEHDDPGDGGYIDVRFGSNVKSDCGVARVFHNEPVDTLAGDVQQNIENGARREHASDDATVGRLGQADVVDGDPKSGA